MTGLPPDSVVILRPCFVEVEFTDEEPALIREGAADLRLSLEDYMRKQSLASPRDPTPKGASLTTDNIRFTLPS